jgi:hypothetical protein
MQSGEPSMFATAAFVKPFLLMIVVLAATLAPCFGGCAKSGRRSRFADGLPIQSTAAHDTGGAYRN